MAKKGSSPLIFERSIEDRYAYSLPKLEIEKQDLSNLLDDKFIRKEKAALPEISELDFIRHYTELSTMNWRIVTGVDPLRSRTMKYNPKIYEQVALSTRFGPSHP